MDNNFDEFVVGDGFALRFLGGSEELSEMKICSFCKNLFLKNTDNFGIKSYSKTRIRLNGRCKTCERKRLREYMASKKGREKQRVYQSSDKYKSGKADYYKNGRNLITKNNNLKSTYGITLKEYQEMSLKQNDLCYICQEKEKTGHSLSVDHDHLTGKNRKLLCKRCNLGLGYFRDNKSILTKAISYIEEHE